MTNQKMQNSPVYKTYLAYATGAATPKKARKFKKLVSPSKKKTLVTVEEEDPEPSNKVKKALETTKKSKGIDLLSKAALLEEAQGKKVLKRSQWETTIHQVGGSGDGTGSKPRIPDEPKGDDEDFQDSDDDPQQANDERTDYENQEINDYEEESANEFVHTPEDYVPTDDETNDETKDVDKDEYDRIDKELYSDVNVILTYVEQDDEGEEDAYMQNVAHVHVEQTQKQTTGIHKESGLEMASIQGQYVEQATTTTNPPIHNATNEVPSLSSSHSVSSTYTNAFLNLENLRSTKTKVVSMLDINVQHEVPRTSPLLTIPVSIILEHTIFNPSETVITSPATTITSLLSSLFPSLQQSIPIPTPINTEATTSTIVVPKSKTFFAIHQRITNLEKDVKELKSVDNSTTIISAIKSKVLNAVKEYLESSLDDALYKVI
ncbi:hypothetical protein Tco_1248540 [Tanacetum coccineum]